MSEMSVTKKILSYIDGHLDQELSLEKIAAATDGITIYPPWRRWSYQRLGNAWEYFSASFCANEFQGASDGQRKRGKRSLLHLLNET